jgi:xylan 1,4-beta-xylosidase
MVKTFRLISLTIITVILIMTVPLTAAPVRVISLNCHKIGPVFESPLNVCIGGEHAALEINSESLRQLAIAHRKCGFTFIRFHGILNPGMRVVRRLPSGKLVYNWNRVDALYSHLLAVGVKPLVELSFMPRALASGKKTCFYYRGNITPPRHIRDWHNLIVAMLRHLEAKFGRRQVRSWYFEVWNEPNLYNGFSIRHFNWYMKLYAATAGAIDSVDAAVRVGGPATAGLGWIPQFIADCKKQHVPLDFISTHTYGCGPHPWPDGKKGLKVSGSSRAIAGGIQSVLNEIHHSSMPQLPLLITEWGPSYSSRDAVHDTYFQAVWLVQQVQSLATKPALMSYWALSDIFDEDGPQTLPFEGGFGIFNPQGIKKPTFFAMEYLHELRGRRLDTHDSQSIGVLHGGEIDLLAWSYRWPRQTAKDSIFFKMPHPSVPARTILLHVSHLNPGGYMLRIYRVGYRHNDAYTLYQHWGWPAKLTAHQLRLLKKATDNRPVVKQRITVSSKSQWRDAIPMFTNGIMLLKLSPVAPSH